MRMPSNEVRRNLLPDEPIESFWDALWLELWPVFCFTVESRRIACRCLQTERGAICYRRTDRELLGRPVARYSAVFLFGWVTLGPL